MALYSRDAFWHAGLCYMDYIAWGRLGAEKQLITDSSLMPVWADIATTLWASSSLSASKNSTTT